MSYDFVRGARGQITWNAKYRESPWARHRLLGYLVEPMGFEPTTSSMPSRRAPSCATAPPNFSSLAQDYRSGSTFAFPARPPCNPWASLQVLFIEPKLYRKVFRPI